MGPVDEARAYAKLRERMSVAEICEQVGRSDATLYKRLCLIDGRLEEEVLDLINARRLSSDSQLVNVLGRLPSDQQVSLAKKAARSGLSASYIKGMVTRMVNRRPVHWKGRPMQDEVREPARAPALAACNVDADRDGEVVEAVVVVCRKCGMGDDSYNVICRDCPVTQLVRLLLGEGAG